MKKSRIFEEGTVEDLVHIAEDYGLAQVKVSANSNFLARTLIDISSDENPFWIVGIKRGRQWISLLQSTEIIETGDKLVVHGDLDHLRDYFKESS